jgi:hypothetical protein
MITKKTVFKKIQEITEVNHPDYSAGVAAVEALFISFRKYPYFHSRVMFKIACEIVDWVVGISRFTDLDEITKRVIKMGFVK